MIEQHTRLIRALREQRPFPHSVGEIGLVETHISSVLLTGEYAYKIKKPMDFGFLDFTRLEDRKRFCEEEIRLNSRLAPGIYLDTVAITGSVKRPRIGGEGPAIEYAVRMRQFDQTRLLDNLLAQGKIDHAMIDAMADRIADFHASVAVAPADDEFGTPEAVHAPMAQNFEQIRPLTHYPDKLDQLDRLEAWTEAEYLKLQPLLTRRKAEGFIRECHGDMHLGNITLWKDNVAIFDGIEFNDHFRWIDVMSEMAFLTMDLSDRGAGAFAQRLMNRYLEQTGDYEGASLLRFYQVYRALVRAKIASFGLGQHSLTEAARDEVCSRYQGYADLAEFFTRYPKPRLMLMHGVSGSGKSTVSQPLLERIGAWRIRSDRERKRLFEGEGQTQGLLNKGLYSGDATERTYQHLLALSRILLDAHYSVIIDATFLKQAQRQPFARLANELGCDFIILHTLTDPKTLRERISGRGGETDNISDATHQVLDYQLEHLEPLAATEPVFQLDTTQRIDIEQLVEQLTSRQ